MGRRGVLPPEEFADQIWGPGFVQLDFEDDAIKYDCIALGTPGDDVMLCFSVWLTEEVGEPGEEEYRLKHFPPSEYAANFFDWDDVTGLPIFERAVVVHAPKRELATKKPAAKKAAPKKSAVKPATKKPAAKKATAKPTKKAAPKKHQRRSQRRRKQLRSRRRKPLRGALVREARRTGSSSPRETRCRLAGTSRAAHAASRA